MAILSQPVSLSSSKKQVGSIPVLDGVRAIACLIVVCYHINLEMRNNSFWHPARHIFAAAILQAGSSGVTLFFVLSGFLLFLPYAAYFLNGDPWPSTRAFYIRRALRIIPAYYVCLFLLIVIAHHSYIHRDHWPQSALFLTFFMDSTKQTYQAINGPFWSLAVEWQYYLLLPLLALGIRTLAIRSKPQNRMRTVILCLVTLVAWGIISRFFGNYLYQNPPHIAWPVDMGAQVAVFFLFGCNGKFLEDFAIGMLLGLIYVYSRDGRRAADLRLSLYRLSLWLWSAGIVLLTFMALWYETRAHKNIALSFLNGIALYYDAFGEVGFSIGFGLCILAILYGPHGMQKAFNWPLLRWLGLISYSIYMWHLPLLQFFTTHVVLPYLSHWNARALYGLYWLWFLAAVIPIALVSYYGIERPCILFSNRLRARWCGRKEEPRPLVEQDKQPVEEPVTV